MRDALLLALTFSITMAIGLGSDTGGDATLIKHKLYKCSSLEGHTVTIEGERVRYVGECSFGGYFVNGTAVQM